MMNDCYFVLLGLPLRQLLRVDVVSLVSSPTLACIISVFRRAYDGIGMRRNFPAASFFLVGVDSTH